MRMYNSLQYIFVYNRRHLSLFQRLASSGLVGLSGASLCVDVLEVGGRKRSRVARSLERVHCGGQAFEVLAVVFVGLVIVIRK